MRRDQAKFEGKTGDALPNLASMVRQIEVRHGEVVNLNEIEAKRHELKKENESLKEQNVTIQKRREQLYQDPLKAEVQEKETGTIESCVWEFGCTETGTLSPLQVPGKDGGTTKF